MTAGRHSTRLFLCPNCQALIKQLPGRSGSVTHPYAPFAVITKLVEFGYLQLQERARAGAIDKAIGKLRNNLIRAGMLLRQ